MISTNHRDVLVDAADRTEPDTVDAPMNDRDLTQQARAWAQQLVWLPATRESAQFAERLSVLNRRLDPLLTGLERPGRSRREAAGRHAVAARQRAPGAGGAKRRSRVGACLASHSSCAHSRQPGSSARAGHCRRPARRREISLFRPRFHHLHGSVSDRDWPQHGRALSADPSPEITSPGRIHRPRRKSAGRAGPVAAGERLDWQLCASCRKRRGRICWSR